MSDFISLSLKRNKYRNPAMTALNHSNNNVINLLLVVTTG